MQNGNKKNVLAAVAGAVVGAGAVIASVIAMKDKGNQKKVNDLMSNAKDAVRSYKKEAANQVDDGRATIKKVANQAIDKAEKVTKSAKKEVRKI